MLKTLWRNMRAAYLRRRPQWVFSRIHDRKLWSGSESLSGSGSGLAQTSALRSRLPALLEELNVRSLLDAPCGDFHWMKEVDLPVDHYFGIDIVPALIEANESRFQGPGREFYCRNLITDDLPKTQFILCRQLLIHLPLAECILTLRNFKRTGAQFLLVTNHSDATVNRDIPMGSYRPLNLRLPPFKFPEPLVIVQDSLNESDPAFLSLYRLQTLTI